YHAHSCGALVLQVSVPRTWTLVTFMMSVRKRDCYFAIAALGCGATLGVPTILTAGKQGSCPAHFLNEGTSTMTLDLSTNYGGLRLRSPIVVGACPLTANEQTRMAIENAGAGAIVLPSLFEEHVISWNHRRGHTSQLPDPQMISRLNQST